MPIARATPGADSSRAKLRLLTAAYITSTLTAPMPRTNPAQNPPRSVRRAISTFTGPRGIATPHPSRIPRNNVANSIASAGGLNHNGTNEPKAFGASSEPKILLPENTCGQGRRPSAACAWRQWARADIFTTMPPKKQHSKPVRQKSLQQLVEDVGLYPPEAYEFIQKGLSYTVQQVHGELKEADAAESKAAGVSRHISGQQLCEGLRDFALQQWGMLARTVLRRWNVTSTLDFGRIVFALVDAGHMQKTDDDTLEDFKAVYEFRTAFDTYRIGV